MAHENDIKIGGRLHSEATGNIVTGADEIFDDTKGKRQSVVNQEQESINGDVINNIGVLSVQVANRYTKEEVNNIVSRTPETDVIVIDIPSEDQDDIAGWLDANTPGGTDPETGRSVRANKLYRVPGPTNTTFSEWAWDGEAYICLAIKDYGIDNEVKDSPNMVKNSGVYAALPAFHKNSPYQDPNVFRYFVDEENKVFAIQYADGSIQKLVDTPEEAELKRMIPELVNDMPITKEESPYNDPEVLTYYTDEEYKVFMIQYNDGSIRKLALTDDEVHANDVMKNISSETNVQDDDVLKYLTDELGTCFGYIKTDGTVVIYKAEILNYEGNGDAASEKQLATVVSLVANGLDNVKISNNPKFMSTLHNLMGNSSVHINADNDNNKNLRPCISIIDDDTIDNQIPSSKGETEVRENTGGYFSVLLPFLLSLGAKYGKDLCPGLACEGHRVGLTPYHSSDDTYSELNENGQAVKWLHDNMKWNVFNHSMTAQLPSNTYYVDGIDSELAGIILSRGTYSGPFAFSNTIVLDRLTGKWYEVNSTKTAWVERTPTKKYAQIFYREYINPDDPSANHDGPWYFNRDFDFDYSWGEWFKRADELGLPHEKVIVHNGSTTNVCTVSAGRKYAYWSVRTTGTHNYPPVPAAVNRIGDSTGSSNVRNATYENRLKGEIDSCADNSTWMIIMSHFNDQTTHRNYYLSGVTYPDGDPNYPAEWIIPLKREEILDVIGANVHDYINHPPSRLGISTWDEWHPAPGTQLKSLYDVIDYALSKGIDFVSPVEGWNTHGNVLNIGVDRNGQTYSYDTEAQTPYTDDEKSYLTIGADMSIRYYNGKQ